MADLSCGSRFTKFLLFFFNILFWVLGAVLLGVSIWFLADPNAKSHLAAIGIDVSSSGQSGAILLVVVGAMVFVTGFFGCCGACKENRCMLMTYAVILGILLILEIVAAILVVVFRNDIVREMEASMNITVQEQYGKNEQITEDWDFMQKELKCCAVHDPKEWLTSYWKLHVAPPQKTVPDSCCISNETSDLIKCNLYTQGYIQGNGCKQQFEAFVHQNAAILIGVSLGIAALQLLGIILACCLGQAVKNKDYETV